MIQQETKIQEIFDWVGITKSDMDYFIENPYLLYSALTRVYIYRNGVPKFRKVTNITIFGKDELLPLNKIIDSITPTFSYIDPKILKWFPDFIQEPFGRVITHYYQAMDNLSHRQAIKAAKDDNIFRTYSLGQALLLAEEAVKEGLLNWPRKYLIIYINETYENEACRVLAYSYDDGRIEIYVNQMDPGDVWAPGVGRLFY